MEKESKFSRDGLNICTDICTGCSHCMRVCPTEALRVVGGKAVMFSDWCIDCGECLRVCPSRAIQVADDDINQIFKYKHRILLIPAVFFAQFEDKLTLEHINSLLCDMGFTEVCAVEQGAGILAKEINKYVETHDKPVISSFCPAVVRLIQLRFPVLVDHIMQLIPPVEITAQYYKRSLAARGIPDEDLGIFYVTPCAAKIAAVKAPVGGYVSPINGVINMDHLYNKVYLAYKNRKGLSGTAPEGAVVNSAVSAEDVRWSVTGGEAMHVQGRTLSIDGMSNIIEFLEKLENDEIEGVDFLELRACDESCAGGILTTENRFLAVERLKNIAENAARDNPLLGEYEKYCSACIPMQPVEPRRMVKYDVDMKLALEKMEKARRLKLLLPGIDCGACGTPSCEALAEDVVCRDASISNCIFMKTMFEKQGTMAKEAFIENMEAIWGKERFEKEEK